MFRRIKREDVEHVARLARISLSNDEIDRFTVQLGDILDHAADIEALDVGDVPPTSHPLPVANVLRRDEMRPSIDRNEFLSQAPASQAGRFRVPPVLGDEP
mgnify:CR=1 FL=1